MPLPPLPANNTNRLFVDYFTGGDGVGVEHTLSVRYIGNAAAWGTAQLEVLALLSAIGEERFWNGWVPLRARYQEANTVITLPCELYAELAAFTGTGGAIVRRMDPYEARFVGRSPSTGRRVSLSVYGINFTQPDDNYRVNAGDSGASYVAAAVAALNGATTVFAAVDGTRATWYSYMNVQFNSYWEKRARLG